MTTLSTYTSLSDYVALLRGNRLFLLLWLGETVNQFGSWFNYVACFKLVEDLTGQVGIALSVVVVVRSAPRLLWFVVAGGVADAFNRAHVLIASCLLQALVLLAFPLVQVTRSIWLLYALMFVQFTFQTLYDPAKSALIPSIVWPDQLHIAAALDAFVWALMAAAGSSVGGFAVACLGASACFLIDAATFLAAAACATQLVAAAAKQGCSYQAVPSGHQPDPPDVEAEADQEQEAALLADLKPVTAADVQLEDDPPARLSLPQMISKGGAIIARGVAYMAAPDNRDVTVLILLKASGGTIWGASDIVMARLANVKTLQLAHQDGSATLGLLFSAKGIGSIIGPAIANMVVPATPSGWLRAAAAAHLLLGLGYAVLLPPVNLPLALLSSVVRASGSNTLWIYSTTLLQQRVDPSFQGSVFAAELALYTVASSASSLGAGAAFQQHLLSTQGLAAAMAVIAGTLLVPDNPTPVLTSRCGPEVAAACRPIAGSNPATSGCSAWGGLGL